MKQGDFTKSGLVGDRRIFAGLRGILMAMVLMSPGLASACELTMGWEPWEPYQFKGENGDLTGLDVELVEAIAESMDCRVVFEEMPWKRHLKEVEAGGVDLAAGADQTPERSEYAYFSDPYRKETVQLFVRKGKVSDYDLETLDDIPGEDFTLGIASGYHYGDEFEEYREDKAFEQRVQAVRSDEHNYRKLKAGRIDGFLADRVSLAAGIKGTEFEGEFEPYPLEVKSDDIHVMFSRESTSPDQVDAFNKALEAFRESAEYDRIVEKYTDI